MGIEFPTSSKKISLRRLIFVLLLIIPPVLISIPVLTRFTTNEDEGISLYGAIRILNGQVPYRDFWYITLPGAVWMIAGAFKIFGATLITARVLTLLIIIGEGIIVYLIGRRLTERTIYPLLASFFVFLFNIIPSINFTPHKPAVFFALSGFYLALNNKYFLTGISLSASTFFQQNTGVLSAIGVFLFLITESLVKEKTQESQLINNKLKKVTFFILGYVSLFLGLLIYLFSTSSLSNAFYTFAVWPFSGYTEFNRYPYFNCERGILRNALNLNERPLQIMSNLSGIATLGLIGYFPFIIFPYSLYYSIKNKIAEQYSITICGLFLFLSSFTRPDFLHILYTLPVFFVLFLYSVHLLKKFLLNFLRMFLILLVSMVFFERTVAFLNVIVTPHEVLTTPRGKIKTPYYNAHVIRPILEFIEESTKNDEKIFIYHWSPALYFYLGRDNPTRFDSFIPYYNTHQQLNEIIEYLKNNLRQLVIKDDYIEKILDPNTILYCSFPYAPREKLKDDIVDTFIHENYNLAQKIGNFKIFLKR